MRICIVAASRVPVAEPYSGGLEAHTGALTRSLVERGHQVSLFAAPGSDPRLGVVSELPVRRFVPSPQARADVGAPPAAQVEEHHAYLGLMLDLARDGHERYDVVHNNSLHHLPVAMAPALGVPLVTTLHTPPLALLESAIRLDGGTSSFVAVSDHTRRAWRHAVDATVVRNGVDTARWTPGPGGRRAVWVGRLVPEKAPHLAIRAALAAGYAIDLAGPVQDQRYVRDHVAPLVDGSRVRHVGHLTGADLVRLVGGAAVAVVSPVWEEPYGLVAAEALACGTPVAAFRRGALAEIVTPEVGELAAPDDVDDLARAIRVAATRERPAARRHAVSACSHETMVDAYERVYADLAGLRGAA